LDGETKYDGSKERGCNKSAKKYQDSTKCFEEPKKLIFIG
jgi:hypothetical protein